MWKQTWVKAVVICLVVNMVLFLPIYITLIYAQDLTMLGRWSDFSFVFQSVILSFCGCWLGQNALEGKVIPPAHYDWTILQFISRYGLVVMLSAGLIYVLVETQWPFFYIVGSKIWVPEYNRCVLLDHDGWQNIFLQYFLTQWSLLSYWLLYVFYGITKSWRQVRAKRNLGKV